MTPIPDIETMIERRKVAESKNLSTLRKAKRRFDEEKLKIQSNFLEEVERTVEFVKTKLTNESTFEDLMKDDEFTSQMLPYLDEINLSKEFRQKFENAFSGSFHMEFLEVPEISISWYQSQSEWIDSLEKLQDALKNDHAGLEETIPYANLLKMWLSRGENYSFSLEFPDNSIEIGFDPQTDEWFITEIETIADGEYLIHPSPPIDKFSYYEELVKFIENNSFPHN